MLTPGEWMIVLYGSVVVAEEALLCPVVRVRVRVVVWLI